MFGINKNNMKIFNVAVNGIDAERFLSLSKEDKIEWIKENTNQKNDILIEEFLNSPIVNENLCIGCGKLNDKIENPFKDGDISKTDAVEVAESSEQIMVKGKGKRNSAKRQSNA